jgi:predicted peptidase
MSTLLAAVHREASGSPQPLLIFLHGAGEIGGDTDFQVRKNGPWEDVIFRPRGPYHPDAIAQMRKFHVLGLHLADGDWNPQLLNDHINRYVEERSSIDRLNLYITGISRGGRGALRLAIHRLRSTQAVSAVAAFCPEGGAGSFSEDEIRVLRQVPVFLFHCPEDDIVPFEGSAVLHKKIGSDRSRLRIVHLSELATSKYPHVCWTEVYGSPELYEWMLKPRTDPAAWPRITLPYAPAP